MLYDSLPVFANHKIIFGATSNIEVIEYTMHDREFILMVFCRHS